MHTAQRGQPPLCLNRPPHGYKGHQPVPTHFARMAQDVSMVPVLGSSLLMKPCL
jgi:hypothetical protein